MKIQPLVLGLWTLLGLFGLCSSFDDVYTYSRFTEIEKHCNPFLSLASDLKPDDGRSYRLKNELSFYHGDWEQEAGGATLMPFDDSDIQLDSSSPISLLKLVSFEVKDVNPVHQSKNTVSLIGVLYISITINGTSLPNLHSMFLKIVFEGVYIETKDNGGERLLCLLRNTNLPSSNMNDDFLDLSINFYSHYKHQPQFLQDEQIILVLRYPQTFNLTKRAIQGEMRSLNQPESFEYFDKVHMYSQLGRYSKYQFSTEKLISRGCDPHLLAGEIEEDGVNMLTGTEFCKVLQQISHEAYNVEPNWKFSGGYKHHARLGPFLPGKEIKAKGWIYDQVKLIMQNILCELETTDNKTENARVSALLRAVPTSMEQDIAARRTGLSGMTLSVEGIWNFSTGKLCMVGCLGVVDSGLEGCDSQISFYFPRSFSSRQRSIIFGSLSSIRNETDSYLPLLFGVVKRPIDLNSDYAWYSRSYLSYNYSKADKASMLRMRSQPSKLITFIKESLLTYPSLEDGEDSLSRLVLLSNELCIDAYAFPIPLYNGLKLEFFARVELLSLGPLFGSFHPWLYKDSSPVSRQAELTKSEVLNVSLHLMLIETSFISMELTNNILWRLFLEGLYDPVVGEMYLIGCAKVMNHMVESINAERGFDCSIDVKIEYPSENTRWLINPTAKITITSQRNKTDPLHFSPITVQTSVIRYLKNESDVIFRKAFEVVLRILLLLVSVAIISSQLYYMKKNVKVVPYISLTMLAIQILGYSLPLISNVEIFFESKESESYRAHPYNHQKYQPLFRILDYAVKLLLLVALLLTARIFQKVSASRIELCGTSKPRCVLSDKLVLLITLVFNICWFLTFCRTLFLPLLKDAYTRGDAHLLLFWMMKLGEDLIHQVVVTFLLPQFFGNCLWQTRVKPLRRSYVLGFALIWFLPCLYDFIRDPIVDPYTDSFW